MDRSLLGAMSGAARGRAGRILREMSLPFNRLRMLMRPFLSDGTVVTWGSRFSGGDSSKVQEQLRNVSAIQSTARAFAAIRTDGSVVTWGGNEYDLDGGDSSQVRKRLKDVRPDPE